VKIMSRSLSWDRRFNIASIVIGRPVVRFARLWRSIHDEDQAENLLVLRFSVQYT
jgi:hypothetical protein